MCITLIYKMIRFTFFILILVCVLLRVAFITLLERKILRLVGLRLGPNKVSFLGVLQPIRDAIKLSNKQFNSISNFSFFFYYIRCFLSIFFSIFIWSCFWFNPYYIGLKISVLFLMFILSLNTINLIVRGWRTYGKYTLLGSLRRVSQLISYESALYLCLFFF